MTRKHGSKQQAWLQEQEAALSSTANTPFTQTLTESVPVGFMFVLPITKSKGQFSQSLSYLTEALDTAEAHSIGMVNTERWSRAPHSECCIFLHLFFFSFFVYPLNFDVLQTSGPLPLLIGQCPYTSYWLPGLDDLIICGCAPNFSSTVYSTLDIASVW